VIVIIISVAVLLNLVLLKIVSVRRPYQIGIVRWTSLQTLIKNIRIFEFEGRSADDIFVIGELEEAIIRG
jgi:hypothetical protein